MSTKITSKPKFLAAGIAAALMIAPASALAAETTVNWQINLKPGAAYPKATGGAQYQSQPGQQEFQVEVEHILSLAGKSVVVCVNHAEVGKAKVSARGIAQLDRNTELGQKVPSIVHGSTVSVTTGTACTGSLVASGQF
jgi:hypothetical protein